MLTWIIGSSLKFRFLVLAAAVALLVFGTGQLRKMPVDVFPEFAPPKVEVQKINFPIGYCPHPSGEYKQRQAAQVRGQQSEVRPWA